MPSAYILVEIVVLILRTIQSDGPRYHYHEGTRVAPTSREMGCRAVLDDSYASLIGSRLPRTGRRPGASRDSFLLR
jgi:hypothetical protein